VEKEKQNKLAKKQVQLVEKAHSEKNQNIN
jgi:hypothetical protein